MTQRQLMGVREAAKALGVAASTISRGIGVKFANHGTQTRPLVDLDEVRTARANHIEPERQAAAYKARGMQLPLPEPDGVEDDGGEPGSGVGRLASADGELGRERVRKVRGEADRVEMDNLERQGQLAPVGEFADAGFVLGQMLRRALHAREAKLTAAVLAVAHDPAGVRQAIAAADRALETALADRVERFVNGETEEEDSADHP